MKKPELTEEQLKEIERQVFEAVPVTQGEITGIGFCATRRRERNATRMVIRQNLIRKLKLNIQNET